MTQELKAARFEVASIVFTLLDPIPYGLFVGALLFDAVYFKSAEVLWVKAAAWLIAIGLVTAVLPRVINLIRVWLPSGSRRETAEVAGFFLNLLAIATAVMNAFVHSRDAYGTMPEGLWLSGLTVFFLVIARVLPSGRQMTARALP